MRAAELSRVGSDRGVATILAAGAVAALIFLSTFLFWLGAAVLARHRAEGAADLAALAAAGQAGRGTEAACARARQVTGEMGADLAGCRLADGDAFIEVTTALPGVLARFGATGAHARAGPVDRPP